MQMTWAPFSEIALYARAYIMPDSNHYLEEIRRVMDFQHLFIRNPNYTRMITEMDIFMADIYRFISDQLLRHIDRLNNTVNSTPDPMKSTLDFLNASETKYEELMHFMGICFFLKAGANPEYLVDDFGARLAHDVLRDLGHMDPFIQTINTTLTELYQIVLQNMDISINSDLIIRISTCLSKLQSIHAIHQTLNKLVRADRALTILEKWKGDLIDTDYTR